MGRAAKVQRFFESAMTDFTEQLQWNQTSVISNQTSVINNQPSLHHVGVFLGGLIAGTGLGSGAGHLVVAADDGLGELLMELEKETD